MKKSISITFTFDFAIQLSSFSLFDIGTNKDYFDHQKSVEDFASAYNSTFKAQLKDIAAASQSGVFASIYLSTDFIQLLQEVDSQIVEDLRSASSDGSLEFLGGLDRPSLSSIYSERQFIRSILLHQSVLKAAFGVKPITFYNFENIFFTGVGSILSDHGFKASFSGAIDWYLGSNLHQRVFHLAEKDQFKILLVDRDQTKSLFHIPEIQSQFLHFNSEQITHLEGVDAIISKAFDKGKIIPIKKQIAASKTTLPYHIKNPIMGSTQNLMLDSFNGNALQNQILKQYYQMEEMVETSTDKKAIPLWDKLGHSEYLHIMNVLELNATKPYTIYNQLNNILTDLKLELEG